MNPAGAFPESTPRDDRSSTGTAAIADSVVRDVFSDLLYAREVRGLEAMLRVRARSTRPLLGCDHDERGLGDGVDGARPARVLRDSSEGTEIVHATTEENEGVTGLLDWSIPESCRDLRNR